MRPFSCFNDVGVGGPFLWTFGLNDIAHKKINHYGLKPKLEPIKLVVDRKVQCHNIIETMNHISFQPFGEFLIAKTFQDSPHRGRILVLQPHRSGQ